MTPFYTTVKRQKKETMDRKQINGCQGLRLRTKTDYTKEYWGFRSRNIRTEIYLGCDDLCNCLLKLTELYTKIRVN